MTGRLARWSIVLTLFAAMLACTAQDGPQAPSPVTVQPADDIAIYRTLLTTGWTGSDIGRGVRLIVQTETEAARACAPSGPGLVGAWQEVMASFQAENAQWRALAAGQDLGRPYDLASSADIRAFFAGNRDLIGAWRGFYDRYPESGGFVRLSAVGFDASRTRGLVSIEHQCGFLCGSGGYLFVEKLGGVWRIVQVPGAIYCTWIS